MEDRAAPQGVMEELHVTNSSLNCVAMEAGQPCPNLVASAVPAPLCHRHRMQIAIAVVPEMLLKAAGADMRPPRHVSPDLWGLIDSAPQVPAKLDGAHAPCVYFLSRGDRLKIGYTTNLGGRLNALHADAADVLLTLKGGTRLEIALHERYADFRIGTTEWFERAPCLEEFIQAKRGKRMVPIAETAPPSPRTWVRYPVDVGPDELKRMAAITYDQANRGVHLSTIIEAFQAKGVSARWRLADLARAYEEAGVKVRPGVRAEGRVSIGIHRDDLPAAQEREGPPDA